jgi:hypothetical protein
MENPATTDDSDDASTEDSEVLERYEYGLNTAFFKQNYETYKD